MLIDFHYHYLDKAGYEDNLLREMDHAGIAKTSVSAIEDLMWFEGVGSNEKVLAFQKKYPDRILGAVYIDPRKPDAAQTLERYVGEGFKSVKMFPPTGFFPDDEQFFPLYEQMVRHNLPVLFHTGLTGLTYPQGHGRKSTSSFYAHPMRLDTIAKAFPELHILLAHMGFPYFTDAWSVAYINPNVYLDFAGISVPKEEDGLSGSPWIGGAPVVYNALGRYIPIDFDRVIWGSDNCAPQDFSMAQAKKLLLMMGASEANFGNIFGANAEMLISGVC